MTFTDSHNYARIEKAIRYLSENFRRQPSLEEVAGHVGLSASHFQRMFSEWAGVSPKKFMEFLTIEALKEEIATARSVAESADSVGLSSQSRVYDLFVNIEAMTPGEYRDGGKGLSIEYGFAKTPFGECVAARTPRGLCAFAFTDGDRGAALAELQSEWPNAALSHNDIVAEEVAGIVFRNRADDAADAATAGTLALNLRGTPFQIKVWQALLKIPFGEVVSYSALAEAAGKPDAVRAVASAVARNPIGYIIPCHRVIRGEGVIGQYRWKPERKAAIIGWEKSAK